MIYYIFHDSKISEILFYYLHVSKWLLENFLKQMMI